MPKGYKKQQPFTLSEPSVMDEFMADYVDGSMDKQTRKAYEEYLRLNPQLADDLHKIQEVRQILCGLDCKCVAPDGFQLRMQERLACEFQDDQYNQNGKSSLFVTSLVIFVLLGSIYGLYLDQDFTLSPIGNENIEQISVSVPSQTSSPSIFVDINGELSTTGYNALNFTGRPAASLLPLFQVQKADLKLSDTDSLGKTSVTAALELITYP